MTTDEEVKKNLDLFGWVFITIIVIAFISVPLFLSGCVTMTKKNYEDTKSLSYTQGYVDGLFFCSGIKKKEIRK
jgi:hypothetical protein